MGSRGGGGYHATSLAEMLTALGGAVAEEGFNGRE